MQGAVQEALRKAQGWVSREELETMKEKYRDLAKVNPRSPVVRMIAALDRAYSIGAGA